MNPGKTIPNLTGMMTKIGVRHFFMISICYNPLLTNKSIFLLHRLIIINTNNKAYAMTRPIFMGSYTNLVFRNTPTTMIRIDSWIRKKNTVMQAISTKLNTLRILMQLQTLHMLPYFLAKCLQTGIMNAIANTLHEHMKTGRKLAIKLYSFMNSYSLYRPSSNISNFSYLLSFSIELMSMKYSNPCRT